MMESSASRKRLFREPALRKIRSPEQLDALLVLAPPLLWLALGAAGLALAAALAWACLGSVWRSVPGQGIIVRDSNMGLVEVPAPRSGSLRQVLVAVGDPVEPGQVLARFDLPDLLRQIEAAQAALPAQFATVPGENQREHFRELEARYDREGAVRSVHLGRITEVIVSPGSFVQPGHPLLRMESLDGEHEALLYLPADEAGSVRIGFRALLSPAGSQPERDGFLVGRVSWVSPYPVTREYLLSELGGNADLATAILRHGGVVEVVVTLEEDPTAPGGFRWTSPHGAAIHVGSGSLCRGRVLVGRESPISLLFPFLESRSGSLP